MISAFSFLYIVYGRSNYCFWSKNSFKTTIAASYSMFSHSNYRFGAKILLKQQLQLHTACSTTAITVLEQKFL